MRIPVLSALIVVFLSVLADLYILRDINQYCNRKRKRISLIIYGLSSLLCWAYIIVVLCLPRENQDDGIQPVMWMLFAYLSVYIPKFFYVIFSLVGRLFPRKNRNKINYGAITGLAFGALIFISMWWGVLVTRKQIEVNKTDIVSDKIPSSFDGFKVLQFSDMHLGTWGNDTTFISKLIQRINSENPDIILFTGDFVNQKSAEMRPFLNILARLKAPHGVYGVYGNHDYGGYVKWPNSEAYKANLDSMHSYIAGFGMKMLNNNTDFIKVGNDSIVLIGVENWGEPPFDQLGDLGKSYPDDPNKLQGLNDNMFKILMTHNPMHWKEVVTDISNIDLSLSGHTHAMQMMAKIGKYKWSPSGMRYPQWGGLYETEAKDGNPMRLYVNIGVGEVGFPARIWAAYPEISMFTLHSSKTDD